LIEAQKMTAVAVGFADPQFADDSVFGKNFLHFLRPPDVVVVKALPRGFLRRTRE
jgi:hypothetical protein